MRQSTINRLSEITEEEQRILNGNTVVEREVYASERHCFEIDSKKMIQQEQYLAVRSHTRFVDFPAHTHNFTEIMYVVQGSITHVIDGKEIVLHAGDMIFLNQHVVHSIRKAGKDDIGINFLVLPQFFEIPLSMVEKNNNLARFIVNTFRQDTIESEYLIFRTEKNLYIDNLMENIIVSFLDGDLFMQMQQVTMGMIFLHLLQNIEYLGKESSRNYEDVIVNTALQYIEENYRKANLTDLSERVHMSVSSMSKLIKRSTGSNFKDLLQRKRLQKAVVLLMETSLNISDIMNAVGYENSSYFYNQFREKYGMSPKEYRMNNKG